MGVCDIRCSKNMRSRCVPISGKICRYNSKHVSFKEFFEKSKKHPELRQLVTQCFTTSIMTGVTAKRLRPSGANVDLGIVALNTMETLAKLNGIILTEKEEITAEYIEALFKSYGEREG